MQRFTRFLALCGVAGAVSVHAQTTNWVAYNDHAPSANTAPNATGYNMRGVASTSAAGSVLTGNLKNFATGDAVPVVLTSTAEGTPDDFGSSANPNAGTPAYNLFNGIVDFGNANSMIGVRFSTGSKARITFTNLDPNKRYVFKGTSVRGNNYTRRWTLVTLEGTDGFVDDHSSPGVYTDINGMTPNQAAWNSGENRADGAVVGWKEINPGADGSFSLLSEQWNPSPTLPNGETADTGNYGYALNGMMLAEVEVGPVLPPSIVNQPANVTTNEGSVATLSVSASGSGSLTYQWYHNNTAIAGPQGARSALVLTNISGTSTHAWSIPTDGGDFYAVVTGAANPPATSHVAHVTILADTNAPRFLWAIAGTNASGGTTIQIRLSETVANPLSDYSEVLNWVVNKISGPGASLDAPDLVGVTNNDIYLEYSAATIDPGTTYQVEYSGAPFYDFAETPNYQTQFSVPILAHEGELLPMTAIWKYNDTVTTANTAATWFQPGFNDTDPALWKSGPGPFDAKRDANGTAGVNCRDLSLYNLGNVGTCINRTNELTGATNAVVLFRTHFNVGASDPTNSALLLSGKFDDGAVVYLNGTEIWRVGEPAGALSWTAFQTSRTVGDSEGQDTATLIHPGALRAGDNLIAVEVHQQSDTSSDLTMGLRVAAVTLAPFETGGGTGANLRIGRNAATGAITITWTGTGVLQQSTDLGPGASWSDVTGAGANSYTFTPAAGAGHLFFRTR